MGSKTMPDAFKKEMTEVKGQFTPKTVLANSDLKDKQWKTHKIPPKHFFTFDEENPIVTETLVAVPIHWPKFRREQSEFDTKNKYKRVYCRSRHGKVGTECEMDFKDGRWFVRETDKTDVCTSGEKRAKRCKDCKALYDWALYLPSQDIAVIWKAKPSATRAIYQWFKDIRDNWDGKATQPYHHEIVLSLEDDKFGDTEFARPVITDAGYTDPDTSQKAAGYGEEFKYWSTAQEKEDADNTVDEIEQDMENL